MAARGFLERSLEGLLRVSEHALRAERANERAGFLQRVDPRAKLVSLLALLIAVGLSRQLLPLVVLFSVAALLALLAGSASRSGIVRIWGMVILFTSVIVAPALFLTPGPPVASVAGLDLTATGARTAAFLFLRTLSAVTFAWLLMTTTPWGRILSAMRSLGVPAAIVLILQMTYRYIFVLLQSAKELLVAARSRTIGQLGGRQGRAVAGGLGGALLSRSVHLSREVHLAMLSRGFAGEVRMLDAPAATAGDWAVAAASVTIAAGAVILGR